MTEIFGFPAPENQVEFCELCSDKNTEVCHCNMYERASAEEKVKIDEILEGE